MSVKMTKKRVAAERCARVLKYNRVSMVASETLYAQLESDGHIWNQKTGEWERGSKSMFKDADGEPTGLIRLRVMGNPADIDRAVEMIRVKLHGTATMADVSEHYPNRRGEGVRVYVTLLMQDQGARR